MSRALPIASLDGVHVQTVFDFTEDGGSFILEITRQDEFLEFSFLDMLILAISCWKIWYRQLDGHPTVYDGLIRDTPEALRLSRSTPRKVIVNNGLPVMVKQGERLYFSCT